MSIPLQIIVKSTGKLIQCIQRIARGCFRSRRILGTTNARRAAAGTSAGVGRASGGDCTSGALGGATAAANGSVAGGVPAGAGETSRAGANSFSGGGLPGIFASSIFHLLLLRSV